MSGSVSSAINKTIRVEWGRILASLTKTLGDISLAEDCLQDAVESALIHWERNGLPNSPAAWLIQTARRKAIDRIRRQKNFQNKQTELAHLMELDVLANAQDVNAMEAAAIPDKRLEMIFTCCHPAIEEKSRLALTLRTLGGLTTQEIARAFLDRTEAMAARLTRAKKKIATAGIAYEIPPADRLAERLTSVLGVIYLIHNEGYHASAGDDLIRRDLTNEAIRLAETVHQLLPDEAEAAGLLCLLLLHQARYPARQNASGEMVSLEFQDRKLWERAAITKATELLKNTLAMGRIGPYQLQAAISACHAEAISWADTDWAQIAALYDLLNRITPNPVIALNMIYARSHSVPLENALEQLSRLSGELDAYQPFHATKADILARAGRAEEAILSYERAISMTENRIEREFLAKKCDAIS